MLWMKQQRYKKKNRWRNFIAIDKLNKIEKAIIMLYMDDRSYEEMEDILGINQGNLRWRWTV